MSLKNAFSLPGRTTSTAWSNRRSTTASSTRPTQRNGSNIVMIFTKPSRPAASRCPKRMPGARCTGRREFQARKDYFAVSVSTAATTQQSSSMSPPAKNAKQKALPNVLVKLQIEFSRNARIHSPRKAHNCTALRRASRSAPAEAAKAMNRPITIRE